jgi:hypothetical protein
MLEEMTKGADSAKNEVNKVKKNNGNKELTRQRRL